MLSISDSFKVCIIPTWLCGKGLRLFSILRLYYTIKTIERKYKKPFDNIVGKGENAGNQNFLLSQHCFLPFLMQILIFYPPLVCRLQICEILLFGKEIMHLYHGSHCTYPCFPRVSFSSTCTSQDIRTKTMAAFADKLGIPHKKK